MTTPAPIRGDVNILDQQWLAGYDTAVQNVIDLADADASKEHPGVKIILAAVIEWLEARKP